MPRRRAIAAAVALLVATTLAPVPVAAFFPRQSTASALVPGSTSHEQITRLAIGQILLELGIEKPSKATKKAIGEIASANIHVDDSQKTAESHFDGESFEAGQQRIVGLLARVKTRLAARDGGAARESLGQALHTLQDYYSHSNWVELGNTATNPAIAQSSPVVKAVGSDVATCGPCPPAMCMCQNKVDLVGSALTSGYYPGEDRVKPKDGKCDHGGFMFGALAPADGINKDSNDCTYSPHALLHTKAASLAIDATTEVVRELRQDLPADQFRLLLGLGPVVIFGIDTSRDNLLLSGPGAQLLVRNIVNDELKTDHEPSQ